MKKIITSLLLVAASALSLNAQLQINEGFTSPFNPNTNGWVIQNLSAPTNTFSWFQGAPTNFPAFVGAPPDYISVNFNSTTGSGNISNWLLTPTVTITNGAVLSFATRTSTNPAQFADRLEVYMSTAGTGTNVGTTATSVGTFSTLVVSVNPNLTLSGYPGIWTVYTYTVTGIGSPTLGRFGFRYNVPNGGPNGANSDLIGLDEVKFGNSCGGTLQSFTICPGASATLIPMNIATPATYTWSPGVNPNTSSLVVTPVSTTVYSLNYSEGNSLCPTITSTVTVGNQLSINITNSANSNTICSGRTVTLTAMAAASSYTWVNSMTVAQSITVSPSATTVYTVAAQSGFSCFGANTYTLNVIASPTLAVALSPSVICAGQGSITATASGAATYTFFGSTTNPNSTATPTVEGVYNFVVGGTGTNGCTVFGARVFTVNSTPTVTATGPTNPICVNNTTTLSASGASTYSWSNGATTAISNYSNATAGGYSITATGTGTNGCKSSAAVSVSVTSCTGILKIDENSNSLFFPNPFTNSLKITGFNGVITVYNAAGQVVIRTDVADSAVINTTELAAGIYIVQGTNTDGDITKMEKLVKN